MLLITSPIFHGRFVDIWQKVNYEKVFLIKFYIFHILPRQFSDISSKLNAWVQRKDSTLNSDEQYGAIILY